jgi:hypothetical protein
MKSSPKPTVTPHSQLRLTDVFKKPYTFHSTRAQAITLAIAKFIAKDLRPYSVVENPGFIHLINTLDEKYQIPSRAHFSQKVIPDLYQEEKQKVLMDLHKASSIAITTDGWTSRNTESYITVTAHYIDSNWILQNKVLQTRVLNDSHTGKNIATVLTECVNEWNLQKNEVKVPIVTDNASNMDVAVKEAAMFPHIKCLAHTVNLAAQKALNIPQVSRLLGRVRRIVGFFHRSSHATHVLTTMQGRLGLPEHKLIQDVSTRWNSAFDMLDRYTEQQAAICSALIELKKNASDIVTLSDTDYSEAESLIEVLKVLKTVTLTLCEESKPTVSMILPIKQKILNAMKVILNLLI